MWPYCHLAGSSGCEWCLRKKEDQLVKCLRSTAVKTSSPTILSVTPLKTASCFAIVSASVSSDDRVPV
jgi:hypothetical protein